MNAKVEAGRHPIFIVGSPRSGTSAMIDVLLAAGYHGFREGNFLPSAYRICAQIDQHFSTFDIGTRKIVTGCVDHEMLKRNIYHLFQDVVDRSNIEKPWFGKTGGAEMMRFLPVIAELWPIAVVVMLTRRGLENVTSRLKNSPQRVSNTTAWIGPGRWARSVR